MDFSLTHRVEFSETDAAGFAHFSNFFRWMEKVEHAWFRSLGLSVAMRIDGAEIGWPRVSAGCDYQSPVRFEDEIDLQLRIKRIGNTSLSHEVRFFCHGRQVAIGTMTTVCCAIGPDGARAIKIPPAIRQALSREPTATAG